MQRHSETTRPPQRIPWQFSGRTVWSHRVITVKLFCARRGTSRSERAVSCESSGSVSLGVAPLLCVRLGLVSTVPSARRPSRPLFLCRRSHRLCCWSRQHSASPNVHPSQQRRGLHARRPHSFQRRACYSGSFHSGQTRIRIASAARVRAWSSQRLPQSIAQSRQLSPSRCRTGRRRKRLRISGRRGCPRRAACGPPGRSGDSTAHSAAQTQIDQSIACRSRSQGQCPCV